MSSVVVCNRMTLQRFGFSPRISNSQPNVEICDFNSAYNKKDTTNRCISHVEEEESMVSVPNTVIQPGTMMIHLENTFVTNRAVMGSWRLWNDTFLANTNSFFDECVLKIKI